MSGTTSPGPRGRGRPRSAEAERAIVAATVDLLQEKGFAGLSMEAVAHRAGVGKTTIYRRWPSKDELVIDVLARIRGPVAQVPAGRSVREDLVFLAENAWDQQSAGPGSGLLRRLVAEVATYPELTEEFLRRVVDPRRAIMLDVLRRGVREGVVREDVDLDLAAEAVIAPILIGSWIPFGPHLRRDDIPRLVDLVLAGLTPPG